MPIRMARIHLEATVVHLDVVDVAVPLRGEHLGDATVAYVVAQVSPLKLRFRLPERHLAKVEKGQLVRARVDPYPDEVFEGRITVVVRAVDAATRTFVVEAEIPNRDERLKPGLFARVELELAGESSSRERSPEPERRTSAASPEREPWGWGPTAPRDAPASAFPSAWNAVSSTNARNWATVTSYRPM